LKRVFLAFKKRWRWRPQGGMRAHTHNDNQLFSNLSFLIGLIQTVMVPALWCTSTLRSTLWVLRTLTIFHFFQHLSFAIMPHMMDDNNTTTSPDMANCTHPSLPPFQSPATEPSPPSIDNDDVEILGVVSPPDSLSTLQLSKQARTVFSLQLSMQVLTPLATKLK
jgi:hypothetical protein